MGRRKPKSHGRSPLPPAFDFAHVESGPGTDQDDYVVRQIPGSRALKIYRCPGCDHEIQPGVAHVVVWPTDDASADDRRHWHRGCWDGRRTRGITRRWS